MHEKMISLITFLVVAVLVTTGAVGYKAYKQRMVQNHHIAEIRRELNVLKPLYKNLQTLKNSNSDILNNKGKYPYQELFKYIAKGVDLKLIPIADYSWKTYIKSSADPNNLQMADIFTGGIWGLNTLSMEYWSECDQDYSGNGNGITQSMWGDDWKLKNLMYNELLYPWTAGYYKRRIESLESELWSYSK